MEHKKPKLMSLIEKWATVFVCTWCAISALYGVSFVSVELGIAIPLMSLFMFFASCWGAYAVLYVQVINKACSIGVFGFFVYFTFAFGIFGFVFFVFGAFLDVDKEYTFHTLAASPFVLGVALGASKVWGKKTHA